MRFVLALCRLPYPNQDHQKLPRTHKVAALKAWNAYFCVALLSPYFTAIAFNSLKSASIIDSVLRPLYA
ncbi:MAG: hypothetical protein V7K69_11325 [Nostoc sp.]|uniref:hypothetical protein n=1 Tax=Nostoc sp. TaxID=1180 RepID=UPI002FF578B9